MASPTVAIERVMLLNRIRAEGGGGAPPPPLLLLLLLLLLLRRRRRRRVREPVMVSWPLQYDHGRWLDWLFLAPGQSSAAPWNSQHQRFGSPPARSFVHGEAHAHCVHFVQKSDGSAWLRAAVGHVAASV
jgi:MYXO-CTERM domain-containing protein